MIVYNFRCFLFYDFFCIFCLDWLIISEFLLIFEAVFEICRQISILLVLLTMFILLKIHGTPSISFCSSF